MNATETPAAVTYEVRVFGHTGNVLFAAEGPSVNALMVVADINAPTGSAVVRSDRTSDGSYWGLGRGRAEAIRFGNKWER